MTLPLLPGNDFNKRLGVEKFHKSHCFDYRNEVSAYVGFGKTGIGGCLLPGDVPAARTSQFPRGKGSSQPAWVAFDRQVLCFFGYCQEPVHERREERNRSRKVKVYFYLEDDTVQVEEPKQENSAIPQGTMIRRHRIQRPAPHDDTYFTVDDFNVGNIVTLYARSFQLTGCDQFTRNFLTKLGKVVPEGDVVPDDSYTKHRKSLKDSMEPLRPYERYDTLRQFLDHDRQVLRFFCLWDDAAENMFGEQDRQMVLHYFLADDTVEILEIYRPNCQRDTIPVFLHRGKLPKTQHSVLQPGQQMSRTILNVFGPMGHGGRHILDNLRTGAVNIDYYHHSDLAIGRVVNVYGRCLRLIDCDGFTRDFYGIPEDEGEPYVVKAPSPPPRPIPPHNDIGMEEDTLANCKHLIPKPPKKDFVKFMEKDRQGLNSHVLRFLARLDTRRPIDQDRRFVISVFLSDDTIAVYEPPQRNSGVIGGTFLARTRIVDKAAAPNLSTGHPQYYKPFDFFIGASLNFNKHEFILLDADDYVFEYMEENSVEFPKSDFDATMATLQEDAEGKEEDYRVVFDHADSANSGWMDATQFRAILGDLAQRLTPHEVITIARAFGKKEADFSLETLAATAQEQLRKANFESFRRLMELLAYEDEARSGHLPRGNVRRICRSFKIPITLELLEAMLDKCPRNDTGDLNYGALIQAFNWREEGKQAGSNEAATTQHVLASFAGPQQTLATSHSLQVDYRSFLARLFG